MARHRLLIVDDEEAICYAFAQFFADRGYEVETAASAAAGTEACTRFLPDVIFLDVCLPDADGIGLLEALRATPSAPLVVVITAFGSLDVVTRALSMGAYDYLAKPLDLDQAVQVVERALKRRRLCGRDAPPATADAPALLVGRSPVMQEVYKHIARAAQVNATVLILGETGTGKELVARALHQFGPRRDGPFVAVNCGALPESLVESELFGFCKGTFTGALTDRPGRFEAANHGTLFLDEVGELPPAAQVKLLRFLDTQQVERLGSVEPRQLDVRVVGATNCDLRKAVQDGRFRADLFFRLSTIQICVPPLHERREDIPLLVQHFLTLLCQPAAPPPVSPDALTGLDAYSWPGNVRELRNAVEHALLAAAGGPILPSCLPESVTAGPLESPAVAASAASSLAVAVAACVQAAVQCAQPGRVHSELLDTVERQLLRCALVRHGGNQSAAANWLGIHRNSLRRRLHELGVDASVSSR